MTDAGPGAACHFSFEAAETEQSWSGIKSTMLGLMLRQLGFIVIAAALGIGLWFVLLAFGIYVLDSPTPECSDSGTCDTYGQVLWGFGGGLPAITGCILLSGAFVWLLFRMTRRSQDR
jgi:hypothetical protein